MISTPPISSLSGPPARPGRTGAYLHLVDVGGVCPLAAACHHGLAAAVGHPAALGLWRQDVRAVLPVGRAVASAASELEQETGLEARRRPGWGGAPEPLASGATGQPSDLNPVPLCFRDFLPSPLLSRSLALRGPSLQAGGEPVAGTPITTFFVQPCPLRRLRWVSLGQGGSGRRCGEMGASGSPREWGCVPLRAGPGQHQTTRGCSPGHPGR